MPDPEIPKWWQVVEGLASDIRTGIIRLGDRLPTPRDLTVRFDCDQNTIRRAYDHLRDLGVINPQSGRGTYVIAIPPVDLMQPSRGRVSALERRLNERMDRIERQLDEHLRDHP